MVGRAGFKPVDFRGDRPEAGAFQCAAGLMFEACQAVFEGVLRAFGAQGIHFSVKGRARRRHCRGCARSFEVGHDHDLGYKGASVAGAGAACIDGGGINRDPKRVAKSPNPKFHGAFKPACARRLVYRYIRAKIDVEVASRLIDRNRRRASYHFCPFGFDRACEAAALELDDMFALFVGLHEEIPRRIDSKSLRMPRELSVFGTRDLRDPFSHRVELIDRTGARSVT